MQSPQLDAVQAPSGEADPPFDAPVRSGAERPRDSDTSIATPPSPDLRARTPETESLRAFAPAGQLAGWWGPAQLALDGTPMVPPALVPDGAPPCDDDRRGLGAPSSASDQLPLDLPPSGPQGELPGVRRRRTPWMRRGRLRRHQPIARVARCGLDRIAERVQIVRDAATGRAHYRGVLTCGSVWCCPVCAPRIGHERADQITALVAAHEQAGGRVYLLSLTTRHGLGDDLQELRRGVSNAWRKLTQSKQWKKWRGRVDCIGDVRALETTHGRNGWHPHLHVLLFTRALDPKLEASWDDWLSEAWQSAVYRALGEEHVPSTAHGTDLTLARDSKYLVKLGLELAGDDGRKEAAHGNRTVWQLADDVTLHGAERDAELWRAYALGMVGARQLTWSRGLRQRAIALAVDVDATEEQLAEERAGDDVVYTIEPSQWAALRRQRDPDGLALLLLELAEREGTAGVHAELRLAERREAPS